MTTLMDRAIKFLMEIRTPEGDDLLGVIREEREEFGTEDGYCNGPDHVAAHVYNPLVEALDDPEDESQAKAAHEFIDSLSLEEARALFEQMCQNGEAVGKPDHDGLYGALMARFDRLDPDPVKL